MISKPVSEKFYMTPAITAGLLYILAFPLLDLWPLAFLALVPLFRSIEQATSIHKQAVCGFSFGLVFSFGLGYWLIPTLLYQYNASLGTTILFMVAGVLVPTALTFSIFAAAYKFLYRDNLFFYIIVVPSLWVLAEYTRELIPFFIPWGFIGYALTPFTLFTQAADIGGIYLISYLAVMINSLLFYITRETGADDIKDLFKRKRSTASLAGPLKVKIPAALIIISILLTTIVYGIIQTNRYSSEGILRSAPSEPVKTRIVQGNFGLRDRWQGSTFYVRVHTYLGLGADRKDEKEPVKKLIIWPETVLNSTGLVNNELFAFIHSHLGEDSFLIAGGVRKKNKRDREPPYNTAYLISGKGTVSYYDKNILLPYSETSMFGDLLGSFYNAPAEFKKGETPTAADTSFGKAGFSICFEALYPWHVRNSVREGAEFLVNISNDAWFGDTAEPVMHLISAAMRCIENRRYMVRASNSGISAIISPAGKIIKKTGIYTREVLNGEFYTLKRKTIYTYLGDWILYASTIVILLGLAIIIKE